MEDFRGHTVVLVFYPLDFSPVCTDQLSVYQEVM
ncbi:MAG: redoxin domain-containing protein, partial [Actinomycetota bacterium]|nr:redoxin domain-containing protein [Actinomycetota bacterium]